MTNIQLQQLVERLLYEEESETLDFKVQQYPFVNATKEEKAEVLKDILAFTNAWRRSDAYILVGVKEVKGGKSTVVGVTVHLEDASLQQFVNSKTQRPVRFSYQAYTYENKPIGILCIPVQDRPVYLKNNYGGLIQNVVYVRRGTSTAEANPDEIKKMGEFDSAILKPSPLLELTFFDKEMGECIGKELDIHTQILHFPEWDKIPDYGTRIAFGISSPLENKDYYRELAEYYSSLLRIAPVGFAVKNDGNALASNVRLEIQIEDANKDYLFLYSLPDEPSKDGLRIAPCLSNHFLPKDAGVIIERYGKSWHIQVRFGNVQPGQTAKDECSFYFGASRSCQFRFDSIIFSDEIPEPVQFPMTITVEATEKNIDIETFLKHIQTN